MGALISVERVHDGRPLHGAAVKYAGRTGEQLLLPRADRARKDVEALGMFGHVPSCHAAAKVTVALQAGALFPCGRLISAEDMAVGSTYVRNGELR